MIQKYNKIALITKGFTYKGHKTIIHLYTYSQI